MPDKTIVVTGGSVGGIGFASIVQLAKDGRFSKIVITVRSDAKGEEACSTAAELSGKPKSMFSHVIVDFFDHASIKKAMASTAMPARIDVLLSNAGGLGDSGELTKHGVTELVARNALGNVVFIDGLIAAGKIPRDSTARVVLAGTEASRDLWLFAGFQPYVRIEKEKIEEYMTTPPTRGTYGIGVRKRMAAYGNSKLLAALYLSNLASEQPKIYFATVSPGSVPDTNARNDAPEPLHTVMGFSFVVKMMAMVNGAHPMEVAVANYLKAVYDEFDYSADDANSNSAAGTFSEKFPSGSVVGAPSKFPYYGPCGPLVNQSSIAGYYDDVELQKEAARVLRSKAV